MKLINYYRGNGTPFDCVIHGTIKMNREEFDKIVEYLFHSKDWWYQAYTEDFAKEMLQDDLARRYFIKNSKGSVQGFFINIRVNPTEAIVKHFGLKGYKRGNYQLEVDTSVQTNYSYLVAQAN
jgi:hypothetical protein